MSDYKIVQGVSKYPDIAKQDLESSVENHKADGYIPVGGVSAGTIYNEDGEPQLVLNQAMIKDDD